MLRRCLVVAAAVALVAAPAAAAHRGNLNFRTLVRAVTPPTGGLSLQVLNYDDRFAIQNRSGKLVVIRGYDGEPYARLAPDGTVSVNRRSPAFYLNNGRYTQGVTVPAYADPKAAPVWQAQDRTGRFQWHDHRMHWMGQGLPPIVKDKSKRTKVFDFRIPISIGARPGAIAGTLVYQPIDRGGAPLGAIAALVALTLAGAATVFVVRRRRRPDPTTPPAEGGEGEAERPKAEAW